MRTRWLGCAWAAVALPALLGAEDLRFVILGDRTGEAQPGVFEQVLREAAAQRPAFAVTVGDTIQGLRDDSAEQEWRDWRKLLSPYEKTLPLYLTPGNHDIWSARSEALFRKHAGRPPRYGFSHGPVHVTVLDTSRTEEISRQDLEFLEADLAQNQDKPYKFVISHRPAWLAHVLFRNGDFELHRIVRRHGVRHVIAGHVHQLLRFELDGVEYLSVPSAGGHLRATKQYRDGWFFGYTMVEIRGGEVRLQIHETSPPFGQGRVSKTADWGAAGLLRP